jgi:hypothetical protein
MKEFLEDFAFSFRLCARLYLSPFVGAVRGLQAESKRFDAEYAARYGLRGRDQRTADGTRPH